MRWVILTFILGLAALFFSYAHIDNTGLAMPDHPAFQKGAKPLMHVSIGTGLIGLAAVGRRKLTPL